MTAIFVCYRRGDTRGDAGRLADSLDERFPESQVFRDVESLKAGTDYRQAIETAIGNCSVLLAVIGPRWLNMQDEQGARRLDNPDDFIVLEIGAALAQDVAVIPVLVGGTAMPSAADLPARLKPMAGHQAIEISDARWDYDVDRLADVLSKLPGLRPSIWRRLLPRSNWLKVPLIVLGLVALLATVTQIATGGRDPLLDPALRLIDVDISNAAWAESNCLQPLDCDSRDTRELSSLIRINGSDVRFDANTRQLHLIAKVTWVLREGPTNLVHRGYTGKIYYTAAYQRSAETDRVVIGEFVRRDHTLAPLNGLLAYIFGWIELPFLLRRDGAISSELKRRLLASPATQALQ